ncbi:MAG: hypothetical protein HRT38_01575 [Alteromonadaceae bacterium]|nr:hypothetical protein [Alteromonadaceae bacterium]
MDKEFILLTFIILGVIIMILSCLHIKENLDIKIKPTESTVINFGAHKNITYEENFFTSKMLYNLAIDRVSVDYHYDLKEAVTEYRRIDEDLLRIGQQLKESLLVRDNSQYSE